MMPYRGMTRSDYCPPACRGGQIWNPGSGPYPCPVCQGTSKPAADAKTGA
ncbi:hypothetical protein OIE66_30730 [Nonomuraea sp. NBC_01738]|nr:hypothetical protein OIE66_30730 [Nonomuraea sp. NBC_01738]